MVESTEGFSERLRVLSEDGMNANDYHLIRSIASGSLDASNDSISPVLEEEKQPPKQRN